MSNPFAKPFNANGSFLPEDYVARKAETRANIITLSLFALVMAGVTGAFVVTTRTWQGLRQQQQSLKAEYETEAKKIDQLKALETKRQEILEKAELTAALAERVPRWVLLAELTLRMPDDMHRDMLTFKGKRAKPATVSPVTANAGGTRSLMGNAKGGKPAGPVEKPKPTPPVFEYQLTLAGTATTNNEVADYIAALRESPVLRDVELQYIREAREGDKLVRKFELLAMVRADVDSKILADSLTSLVKAKETAAAAAPKAAPTPKPEKQPLITPAGPRPQAPSNAASAAPAEPVQTPTPPAQGTPVADPQTPTSPEQHAEAPQTPTQDPTQPQ